MAVRQEGGERLYSDSPRGAHGEEGSGDRDTIIKRFVEVVKKMIYRGILWSDLKLLLKNLSK